MPGFTNFATPYAEKVAAWSFHVLSSSYSMKEWYGHLLIGAAEWDASNALSVDSTLIEMVAEEASKEAIKKSICRRREWTVNLVAKLKNSSLTVDVKDGVATIGFADDVPEWCRDYANQRGLDRYPVTFHEVHEWGAIVGIPIFQGVMSSVGWWREPFRHAERFIVAAPDVGRDYAWQMVVPTERRAVNLAKRVEKAMVERAERDAWEKEWRDELFAKEVQPGDAELLAAEFLG